MIFIFRTIFIFTSFILYYSQEADAIQKQPPLEHSPSIFVDDELWEEVQSYLIENHHPIKRKLDQIFFHARGIVDSASMEAAGFTVLPPQHNTKVIIARHPKLKGFILKLYLDEQSYFKNKPEHIQWIKRISGAKLIRRYVKKHNYGHLFKIPKKWMYLLPDEPSPPPEYLRKKFLLIAEDMELFDEKTNEELWRGPWVTEELLQALFKITTDLGLRDSARPCNCPFSIDGKASFIDTEVFERSDVKYELLLPFLSPAMQNFWKKLTISQSTKLTQLTQSPQIMD